MGALGSFLSSFSESFTAAVIMWPFLSFLLTMPILAFFYHRDGRLRFASAAAAYCSVLYLAGLACFTLYPLPTGDAGPGITYGIPPQFNPLNFIFDIVKDGWKAVFQTLFNVVLFLPLGFIAGRFLQMKLPAATILVLVVSCLIETAQLTGLFGIYPYAYRTFEVDDIIFNTLGGVLGWFCAKLFARALPQAPVGSPEITHDPGLIRRVVALDRPHPDRAGNVWPVDVFRPCQRSALFDKAFSLFRNECCSDGERIGYGVLRDRFQWGRTRLSLGEERQHARRSYRADEL